MSESSVFIKQSSLPKIEHKLNYKYLLESIPPDHFKTPQPHLINNKTEWRWRFFIIDNKKFVEISFMEPNKPRLFIDKFGNWITTDILKDYDKFIQNEMYYYTDILT